MPVTIGSVEKHSKADRAGLTAGDEILTVNCHAINDVLDYRFYTMDSRLEIKYLRCGKEKTVKIRKQEYEELGLDFETYLMDEQKSCKNKCIFCFIDQLPKGMRDTLYFKDDDSRLSFLFGNYITMTNLTDADVQRILDMHISPVNISVHTTNPELRCKMMNNRFAGDCLKYLRCFADANIKMNCQLVLCPGINDGEELERSLNDLSELYPSLLSVAGVPVGLTKYREGLAKLEPYNKQTASDVIDIFERFGDDFLKKHGTRAFYAADEFYLKAERKIPESRFYEDFPQIENGVGLWASLRDEFCAELSKTAECDKKRRVSIATGESAAVLLDFLVAKAREKWHNLDCKVYAIKNNFFGEMINVAGLVTGGDLIDQLKGRELGDELLIPECMLRSDDNIFLDDITLEEAERALNIKITPTPNDGEELLHFILKDTEE